MPLRDESSALKINLNEKNFDLRHLEVEISNQEGLGLSFKKHEDENNSGFKSLKDGEIIQRNFEGFETPKSDRKGSQEIKFPSRIAERRESISEAIIEN